jgi:hypothetical protein
MPTSRIALDVEAIGFSALEVDGEDLNGRTCVRYTGDKSGRAQRELPRPWPLPGRGSDVPKGTPGRPVCSIEGCENLNDARGWCQKHWYQWRTHGDPLAVDMIIGDDERRLWSGVDRRSPEECWPWIKAVTSIGYGRILYGGRLRSVHSLVYEALIGPVALGDTLDHACHTRDLACPGGSGCMHRRCCNPYHLEPVTIAENTRRGRSWHGRQTHCKRGHLFDEANTYHPPSAPTHRICRECRKLLRRAGQAT